MSYALRLSRNLHLFFFTYTQPQTKPKVVRSIREAKSRALEKKLMLGAQVPKTTLSSHRTLERETTNVSVYTNPHTMTDHTHAPRLHASAKKLEKQMKMDKLNKSLGRRPDKKSLEKSNVHHTHSSKMSHRNHAAASALERCLKKDAVHLNLRTRPSKGHLYRKGVLNHEHRKIAPSVAGVAKKMEHNMKKMQLNRKLKTQLHKDHLVNSGKIHSSTLGHTLQASSKKLEMAFKRDALNRHLQLRPRTSELERKKILNPDHDRSKIDTSLVPKVKKLEKAFKQDALNRHLHTRPTVSVLYFCSRFSIFS